MTTTESKRTYIQLSIEEREQIQEMMKWEKRSTRYIAKQLHRSISTISREIRRNGGQKKRQYSPRLAHERAMKKRSSRGREERLKSPELRSYTVEKLKLGWSPEQIAGKSSVDTGESISHEAIYQYIYSRVHRNGYGEVRSGHEDLRPYLPLRRKRRMRRGSRKVRKQEYMTRLPSITNRPAEVEERKELGHWEDDLVVSKQSSHALKTLNERVSGVVCIGRVQNHAMAETNRVVHERLQDIPPAFRKTLTRDRGTENMGYRELEQHLQLTCYFANPYHSWERGSNENLNGLIRRFFPKGTDFATITDEQIEHVEYLLNSRPRKRLGWKTPYEVFYQHTGVALDG